MRALLQRVQKARVVVQQQTVGEINKGLLVFLGVGKGDSEATCAAMAKKVVELRIFSDTNDKMNLALGDVQGGCLVVSQFTLYADTTRGRRPFFGEAEAPERAAALCDVFVTEVQKLGISVATGRFGADMQVELVNDGPVTIWLDSN